nr:amidohydrolase family protein [Algoriphagus sp.]
WGDWHVSETIGKERAYRISPSVSALQRGMIFTQHHDAPVAFPDAFRVLSATVNRVSRSGEVIGPDQRVPVYTALKSITDWAAYQAFEENLKGTIKTGKLADFVILDRNPLKIDPMDLSGLKVMATIKEGKTVYESK